MDVVLQMDVGVFQHGEAHKLRCPDETNLIRRMQRLPVDERRRRLASDQERRDDDGKVVDEIGAYEDGI